MSRAFEPQLHTHIELINVPHYNYKYWSLYNGYIVRAFPFLTAIYRNVLAQNLKKLGYPIEFRVVPKDDGHGVSHCPEIKLDNYEILYKWSTRRKTIVSKTKELISKNQSIKYTPKTLAKVACSTRAPKPDLEKQKEIKHLKLAEWERDLRPFLKSKSFVNTLKDKMGDSFKLKSYVESQLGELIKNKEKINKYAIYAYIIDKVAGQASVEEILKEVNKSLSKNFENVKENSLVLKSLTPLATHTPPSSPSIHVCIEYKSLNGCTLTLSNLKRKAKGSFHFYVSYQKIRKEFESAIGQATISTEDLLNMKNTNVAVYKSDSFSREKLERLMKRCSENNVKLFLLKDDSNRSSALKTKLDNAEIKKVIPPKNIEVIASLRRNDDLSQTKSFAKYRGTICNLRTHIAKEPCKYAVYLAREFGVQIATDDPSFAQWVNSYQINPKAFVVGSLGEKPAKDIVFIPIKDTNCETARAN